MGPSYSEMWRFCICASGIYFAPARAGGKLIRRSLKTDILKASQLRLGDLLKAECQAVESRASVSKTGLLNILLPHRRMMEDAKSTPQVNPSLQFPLATLDRASILLPHVC
jgi:hypothetical protein